MGADWAVFKLTVFRKEAPDRCYYFATTGQKAYQERDQWVDNMMTSIGNVTMSLFPPHAITVHPIPEVATTRTRIMAGYLLQSGGGDSVSLLYCELHAYSGGQARLAVYKDEWCQQEVSSVHLADTSTVSTRKGAYCTVFGVDNHRFCARTREEKDLWLRAVSNIKVKLMFDAPDPTDEELGVFRAAVHERIEELEDAGEPATDPLLTSVARIPLMSPRGDRWDPDPIDERSDSAGSEFKDEGGNDGDELETNVWGTLTKTPEKTTGAPQSPPHPPAAKPVVVDSDNEAHSTGTPPVPSPVGEAPELPGVATQKKR